MRWVQRTKAARIVCTFYHPVPHRWERAPNPATPDLCCIGTRRWRYLLFTCALAIVQQYRTQRPQKARESNVHYKCHIP